MRIRTAAFAGIAIALTVAACGGGDDGDDVDLDIVVSTQTYLSALAIRAHEAEEFDYVLVSSSQRRGETVEDFAAVFLNDEGDILESTITLADTDVVAQEYLQTFADGFRASNDDVTPGEIPGSIVVSEVDGSVALVSIWFSKGPLVAETVIVGGLPLQEVMSAVESLSLTIYDRLPDVSRPGEVWTVAAEDVPLLREVLAELEVQENILGTQLETHPDGTSDSYVQILAACEAGRNQFPIWVVIAETCNFAFEALGLADEGMLQDAAETVAEAQRAAAAMLTRLTNEG